MRLTTTLGLVSLLAGCVSAGDVESAERAPETVSDAPVATPRVATEPSSTPTATPEVVLDFGQIEGTWRGQGEDGFESVWIVASLGEGAPANEQVGSVRYLPAEDAPEPNCVGRWRAVSADHPVYEVQELIGHGTCPSGTVRLVFDPSTDTLAYEFTSVMDNPAFDATGTLTRDAP